MLARWVPRCAWFGKRNPCPEPAVAKICRISPGERLYDGQLELVCEAHLDADRRYYSEYHKPGVARVELAL
jgi:hypothetical protein